MFVLNLKTDTQVGHKLEVKDNREALKQDFIISRVFSFCIPPTIKKRRIRGKSGSRI